MVLERLPINENVSSCIAVTIEPISMSILNRIGRVIGRAKPFSHEAVIFIDVLQLERYRDTVGVSGSSPLVPTIILPVFCKL